MSGALQAVYQNLRSFTPPLPDIGAAYEGGYFAGQIGVGGVATHNLVVAPVSSGQSTLAWRTTGSGTTGAASLINGPQNTADLVAQGNATVFPCAHFCNDLSIGGQTDWYLPAKNELEVCYYNLKPTTQSNITTVGTNTNAVPSRTSNYTAGTPAQTSSADFKNTGAEDFTADNYWSSTKVPTIYAYAQRFNDGDQAYFGSGGSRLVRAVRRVAV